MRRSVVHKSTFVIATVLLLLLVGLGVLVMVDTISAARDAGVRTIPAWIAVAGGLFGVSLLVVAAFALHRLSLFWPLAHVSESLRTMSDARDYSQSVTRTDSVELDVVTSEINRLIDAVRQRDETIDRHEQMERNLEEWLKKRRAHELELKEARMAAEDANLTKSHFLASVSHELRTPLHTILSYARFGVRDTTENRHDESGDYFEVILDSADLLLLLLNDLLDLSKLESGKLSFSPTPTSFGDIVGCVVDQFQLSVKQKNIEIVSDIREPDLIMVDATRTIQVVRNLFENAFKYSRPNSAILIDVGAVDGNVTLCVRDQGPGVPEEELATIFESFRQSSEVNTEVGGVGLGLAIARQIVTSQKGLIWAENHADGGLAVFVRFPSYDADIEEGEALAVTFEDSRLD